MLHIRSTKRERRLAALEAEKVQEAERQAAVARLLELARQDAR